MKAKTRLVDRVSQACDLFYSIFNFTTQLQQIRIEQYSYFTGVNKTWNMEHPGTFRNIPEQPGTARNMKKLKYFFMKK